ncbi:MAG TPA: BMC domain-containing protein [Acidimicrobiia bacterium]|nr:BMC domain-containing protein [Acidimicrobiia bacterium]
MPMQPAVALLEFDSIAVGIETGDAMIKRAPLDVIRAGTVHPGKYLVLIGGRVADVEEALEAGRLAGSGHLIDEMLLPDVHDDVVAALAGARAAGPGEALGIIETSTVAAVIEAADAGRKGAEVTLREIRMADGLGGKGYLLFSGPVAEVEAAVEIGCARAPDQIIAGRVIAQIHEEMDENLVEDGRFRKRMRDEA